MTSVGRRLPWEGCYNTRDLGGYLINAKYQTRRRVLLRGDTLQRLTAAGRERVRQYGVHTIIDLRSAEEARRGPYPLMEDPEIVYLNLPLRPEQVSSQISVVESTGTTHAIYCAYLEAFKPQIAAIVTAVARAFSDHPAAIVLVHCHAGKDRTGLVAALLLALAGASYSDIAADYAVSDRYLQPLYEEILRHYADDPVRRAQVAQSLSTAPEVMKATLAHINAEYGDARAYLRSAGVDTGALQTIRRRLRAPREK